MRNGISQYDIVGHFYFCVKYLLWLGSLLLVSLVFVSSVRIATLQCGRIFLLFIKKTLVWIHDSLSGIQNCFMWG